MFRRITASIAGLLFVGNIYAAGIDETIDKAVKPASDFIEKYVFYPIPLPGDNAMPLVLCFLIFAAVYCTIYFGFPNIRYFKHAISTLRGKYKNIESIKHPIYTSSLVNIVDEDIVDTIRDESVQGEVSHFQALSSALSGTIGLGNIAGVAIAIAIGGPGATVWMIISGFLGMSSKFTECTLGTKYRDIGPDGTVYGGPMYYLSKGLAEKGYKTIGKILAVVFAIFCVGGSLGGGNMFQSNQSAAIVKDIFKLDSGNTGFFIGIFLAILTGVVIIGGIKRIGSVAEKIVPFMCGIYIIAGLVVIGLNYSYVPAAFGAIFEGAFSAQSIAGGVIGVLIAGFRRAAFSNEAGVGSAAIAHSAVRTRYPASEGIVALLEPFIDTIIVCTMTALIIVISNTNHHFLEYGSGTGLNGVALTSAAFETTLPGFSYILALAVFLFAFSTMISWSYYGLQAWLYLFGRTKSNELSYKVIFLIFVVIGGSIQLNSVIGISDSMILAMVFPNLIGLLVLSPVVKEEVSRYLAAIKMLLGGKSDGQPNRT